MNHWYPSGPRCEVARSPSSSGVGCLAWVGIITLVVFATFFCLCIAVVGVASASGPRPYEGDDPTTTEPEEPADDDGDDGDLAKKPDVKSVKGARRVCEDSRTMPKRPGDVATGSARTLVGDVCAIEIFASGDSVHWSKAG